jgi:hypothetical protein
MTQEVCTEFKQLAASRAACWTTQLYRFCGLQFSGCCGSAVPCAPVTPCCHHLAHHSLTRLATAWVMPHNKVTVVPLCLPVHIAGRWKPLSYYVRRAFAPLAVHVLEAWGKIEVWGE